MIQSVSMIILMEHDIDAAVQFYQELGGMSLVFHLRGKWAEFLIGDVKIGLCPIDEAVDYDRRPGLVLQVEDVWAFYNQHKDKEIFTSEPIERPHGIMVGLRDPGRNVIDIYQPTPDKLATFVKQHAVEGSSCNRADGACCKKSESSC